MKEIYNGETVALGGVNLVTKQVVVDDSTGERANFTYDKTTGSITVLDSVDPDSVNPVTARAVAQAVAGASGEVPVIGDGDNGKVLKAVVSGGQKSAEWGEAAPAVTVDQTYNASSTNAQSGTAVAGAIATVKQVPASTASDSSKVLTVNAQGAAEWANSPVNADTTNKIIHFGPNLQASYYDGGSQSVPFDLNMSQNGDYVVMEFSLPQHQNFNPNGVVFTIDSDFTVGSLYTDGQAYDCYKILADSTPATDGSGFMFADPATGPTSGKACRGTYTISSGATLVNVLTLKIRFNSSDDAASGYTRILNNWSSHVQVQSTYSTYSAQFIPASAQADSGKVLTVNSSGNPAWATAPGGSAITYLNGTESAKDIMDMLDAGAFPIYKEATENAANDTRYLYYTVTSTRAYVDDQSMPAYSLTLTCLYPQREPNLSDNNYYGRIDAYNVRGSTWTKLNRQTL